MTAALWEWRLNAVMGSDHEDQLAELGAFSWWLGCDGLPAGWRLAQLEALVAHPAVLQPGLFVYEFLASVAAQWPLRVVTVFEHLSMPV